MVRLTEVFLVEKVTLDQVTWGQKYPELYDSLHEFLENSNMHDWPSLEGGDADWQFDVVDPNHHIARASSGPQYGEQPAEHVFEYKNGKWNPVEL